MELTNRLRQRFCKESNIPISIYEEPYFSERMELYGRVLKIEPKWQRFLDSLKEYETEEDYYEDYSRVKETMIEYIKNKPEFQAFNNMDMNLYKAKNQNYKSRDVYKGSNDGMWFISIDMVTANYTSLNYYDSSIFDNTNNWEEFMSQFTKNQHFIQSKYMRQVIMGTCNPSRQVTYEKYFMDQIVTSLVDAGYADQIECLTNDEIVIKVSDVTDPERIKELIVPMVESGITLRTVLFQLHKNQALSGYTLHVFKTLSEDMLSGKAIQKPDAIKLKSLSSNDYPFRIRQLLNEDPADHDKIFVYEGRLAKFIG